MIQVSFDQFQRYNNVAKIINGSRKNPNEKFRILEVGANEHQNLETFLPMDTIHYLDINLPEELQQNPKYILGDATKMDFKDDSFDIIVALDVFEHVSSLKRNQFIDELYRVSSQFFVITAPFHSQRVVEAEERVNIIFKTLFQKNYIWLEEHIVNGLPKQDEFEQYLNSKELLYQIISHGDLDVWEKIMGIHFVAASNPALLEYRQTIDNFYNNHLFEKDYTEESYRKIFIVHKNRTFEAITNSYTQPPEKELIRLDNMASTFFQLASILKLENDSKEGDIGNKLLDQDQIQVYLDYGEDFNENNSYRLEINKEAVLSHFSLNLNHLEPVRAIRIDPSNYAGCFRVDNLILVNSEDEHVTQYERTGNYNFYIDNVLIFENEDPNIILKFDSYINLKYLEFDLIYLSKDYRFLVNELKSKLVGQDQCIREFQSENRILHETVTSLKNEKINLSNLVDEFKLKLNSQNNEIELLRERLQEIERQYQDETVRLQDRLKETMEDLNTVNNQLSGIYNSKSWKLIERMHSMLRR